MKASHSSQYFGSINGFGSANNDICVHFQVLFKSNESASEVAPFVGAIVGMFGRPSSNIPDWFWSCLCVFHWTDSQQKNALDGFAANYITNSYWG
jgi:hypothetical protein